MLTKKKLVASIATAALVVTVGAGATLAYFTDKDKATNTINMGHVSGFISEDSDRDRKNTSTEVGKDGKSIVFDSVKPGEDLSKNVYVELNKGSQDAYLRVKFDFKLPEGVTNVEEPNVVFNNQDNDWSYNGNDGYYYYNKMLTDATEKTLTIKDVIIPSSWGNEYADKAVTMNVNAELIQSDAIKVEANKKIETWNGANIEEYKTSEENESVVSSEEPTGN